MNRIKALTFALVLLLAAVGGYAQCPPVGAFTDAFTGTTTQDGRIFRDAIASSCPTKAYPGIFNVGTTYNYETYTYTNTSAAAACVTVNFDPNAGGMPCGTNAHASAYIGSYDPTNQALNFVGDVGSSITQPFSIEVPAGADLVLVVTNTSAQAICNYAFEIVNLPCAFGAAAANPALGPATLADYESCDVAVQPAATLLLPYFEVDPSGLGENTLVTVTNASDTSIVAHVTVWSNWSFPVLDFNLFLTGYDVVSLSLRDLLVSGNIPNTARATAISPRGVRSTSGGTWIQAPYNATLTTTCATAQGGTGAVPGFLLAQIQSGLTGGPYSAGGVACGQVGDVSDNMVGYITFDTSAVCSQSLPTDAPYFTTEIRWENQLIGDYIRLNDAEGVAGGNPLVHIAALPGGDNTPVTTLEWTFYNRYQGGIGVADRRQPLPALFAGRYIEAGTAFDTDFVIWREGVTDEVDTVDCNGALALNASFPYVEFVRFDERENPTTRTGGCQVSPCPPNIGLSETQLINVNNTSYIPGDPSADTGGWVYFNLTIPEGDLFSWGRPSQNWVQVRMTGASLYGVDFDASYLGNGCQYHVGLTLLDGGTGSSSSGEKIGPKYEGGTLTGWIGN